MNIYMNRQKISILVLLSLIIILIFSYVALDFISEFFFQQPTTLINKLERFTSFKAAPLLEYSNNLILGNIFRFIDEINIFRIKKDLLDGTLPIYDLKLSTKDIEFFDKISQIAKGRGYLGDDGINEWRTAELKYNGKIFNIKTKLHGDTPKHWASNIKSYKIKTSSDEYIENKNRFTLMLFEDRALYGKITDILAKYLNLPRLRDDIIVLKINGIIQGLYYLQEPVDELFLENNEYSNSLIIKIKDNTVDDHNGEANANGVFNPEGHCSAFDYDLGILNLEETDLNLPHIKSAISELFNAIKEKNIIKLKRYFDIDQLGAFEAARVLIAESHMVAGDNLRLIYDGTRNKFYPVLINENLGKLRLINGGFESELNKERSCEISLFYLLNQDEEIRYSRNKHLYELINHQNEIINETKQLVSKYLPYAVSYKTNNLNSRFMTYTFNTFEEYLKFNLKIVKENLEYSKAYIGVTFKSNNINIEFIPDSVAELKIDNLKLNFLNIIPKTNIRLIVENEGKILKASSVSIAEPTNALNLASEIQELYFAAGVNENYYPMKKIYNIKLIFNDDINPVVDKIEATIFNDISKKPIIEDDIYINIADMNNYYNIDNINFNTITTDFPGLNFKFLNNKLTLTKGEYLIKDNLIISGFDEFNIEKGTIIKLAKNKSIISYSPIHIDGTNEENVIITSLNSNEPFGTFGIIGNNKEKSLINYLDLSGGSEAWVNGIFFSGALSIYRTDVEITNSKIHHNYADDGLNIKYGNILIDNSKFYDNFADQVDLDFVTGVVKESIFEDSDGDANGDGLDFSGSKIIVKSNRFNNFQDKGISIGEKTNIILYDNLIADNNNGAAVKDFSNAYFISNIFENNINAINSYMKKPLFGGGFVYVYDNEFRGKGNVYIQDRNSMKSELELNAKEYNLLKESIINEDIEQSFNLIREVIS